MKIITSAEKKHKQEAKNREKIVQYALKHGSKSESARQYFVSLSSVKRWCTGHGNRCWSGHTDRTATLGST